MVIGNLFTAFRTNSLSSNSRQPFLNVNNVNSYNRYSGSYRTNFLKKYLMVAYEKENGIFTGLINMVATDVNEDVFFEPVDNRNGRNRVKKSIEFYERNRMRCMLFSTLVDNLVCGEGYNFVQDIKPSEMIKEITKRLEEKGIPVNNLTKSMFYKANNLDEVALTKRNLRHVASSTIENIYNETEIVEYAQRVAGIEKFYKPEEIIHSMLYNVNGRPGGFTPAMSVLTPLQLDYFMWKNMESMAKNGGQADKLFSVQDIDVNNPAFKRIETELKRYTQVQNRHGSLLLNGKIDVQDLSQLDSMQFKELGFYIATILALQWRIPKSSLPFIIGGTNTKEDTGGNAQKAYYDNINYFQSIFEEIYNSQLWTPMFGTRMKFRRVYKQDEIRETQNQQTRLNNLTFMQNEFQKTGKRLTSDYILRFINGINEEIMSEDLEDIKNDIVQDNSLFRQNLSNNNELNDNSDKAALRKRRSEEQVQSNNVKGKPTGLGKEISIKEMLIKDVSGKEIQRVPFKAFLNLYNEDKAYNKEPPRVFMAESGDLVRFTYKSNDFVYESILPISEVSQINMMNFRKIYKIPEEDMLSILDYTEPVEVPETKLMPEELSQQ